MIENKPIQFLANTVMEQTLSHYSINPLYHYLYGIFGENEALRLIRTYHVGTSRRCNGSTIYWYVDRKGQVRTGHIVHYDLNGNQIEKEQPEFASWAHKEMKLEDYTPTLCLYGEHLLHKSSASTVVLVKEEQTSIIASHFMADFLWLATDYPTKEICQPLQDHNVILIPDLGDTEKWAQSLTELKYICKSVTISDTLEQVATEKQREARLNIADFLLMEETKQMILQRMIRSNPAINLLIDTFQLEIVE